MPPHLMGIELQATKGVEMMAALQDMLTNVAAFEKATAAGSPDEEEEDEEGLGSPSQSLSQEDLVDEIEEDDEDAAGSPASNSKANTSSTDPDDEEMAE